MAAQSCQPATLNKTSPGYAARVWAQPSTQRPDERSRPWPWWRPDRRSKGAREHQTQAKSSNEESFEILPVDQHLSLLPYSNPLSCTNGEQDVERAEEVLTGGRHQSEEARLHQGTAGREILHCVQEFKASTDRKLQHFQEQIDNMEKRNEQVATAISGLQATLLDLVCRIDPRSQERIARLQQENRELRHRDDQWSQAYKLAQQKIKRLEEINTKLKSSVLVKKGEVEGSFVSSDETPAAIAEDYDKLFSRGRHNLVKATRTDEFTGKLLASHMFKIAYEECRRAVACEMFEELFYHHESDTEESSSSRTKLKALHGQLLHLKKPSIQAKVEPKWLALKVVHDLPNDPAVSSSSLQHDPKYAFALDAVELALRMVMIQPPMVIDYPKKFSEDVQDKHSSQWCDEYRDKTDLVYFKPVLYSSGEQAMPIRKGLVGNKPILAQR